MLYLIHQSSTGEPLGVWQSRTNVLYDNGQDRAQALGRSVIDAKSTSLEWDDLVDQLASQTPNQRGQWDGVDLPSAPLATILDRVQSEAD